MFGTPGIQMDLLASAHMAALLHSALLVPLSLSPGNIPHYWHVTSGGLHCWLIFIPIALSITLKGDAYRLSNLAIRCLASQAFLWNLVEASMDPHLLCCICLPSQNHVANPKICHHLKIETSALPMNHCYSGLWVAGYDEINPGKRNPKHPSGMFFLQESFSSYLYFRHFMRWDLQRIPQIPSKYPSYQPAEKDKAF